MKVKRICAVITNFKGLNHTGVPFAGEDDPFLKANQPIIKQIITIYQIQCFVNIKIKKIKYFWAHQYAKVKNNQKTRKSHNQAEKSLFAGYIIPQIAVYVNLKHYRCIENYGIVLFRAMCYIIINFKNFPCLGI